MLKRTKKGRQINAPCKNSSACQLGFFFIPRTNNSRKARETQGICAVVILSMSSSDYNDDDFSFDN